jgi:DNA-directed RNA polymerase beta' subunit
MMWARTAGLLSREFANRADAASFQCFLQRQLDEQKRRDRKEDVEQNASDALDLVTVITTTEAIEFRADLDRLDLATVAALQDNLERHALSRKRLDEMLAKAYVLPDGRRVFKTEDGMRVFDEFGVEIGRDIIDPAAIRDDQQRWEPFAAETEFFDGLQREQAEILTYQAKLDEARERLDAGKMTREEHDRFREDLKAEMPDAVRRQIPELAAQQKPEAEPTAAKAAELDFSDDVVPTTRVSSGFAPR